MPASAPKTSMRSCSATSTPAFRPRTFGQPGAAGRRTPAIQAGNAGGERLRHRLGRGAAGHSCAGSPGCAGRSCGRCRADDDDPGTGNRPQPVAGLLSAEEGEIPAGFAGVFGQIAAAYFQRYGDQSDALAAIAAKNHRNGVDNPYAQMRKDLGYAFCTPKARRTRSSPGHCSAPTARWCPTGPPRSSSPTTKRRSPCAGRWRSAPTRTSRISCRCRSATSSLRRLRGGMGAGA